MEVVNNEYLLRVFNEIWTSVWNEKGFELEFSHESDKFLFKNRHHEYAGTIEFKQLVASETWHIPVIRDHPFIEANIQDVVEIDKVAIKAGSRRKDKIIEQILTQIVNYSLSHDVKGIVALLEPKFYLALRMVYKVPITKIGNKFEYKGDLVVPALLDCLSAKDSLETFSWYTPENVTI